MHAHNVYDAPLIIIDIIIITIIICLRSFFVSGKRL